MDRGEQIEKYEQELRRLDELDKELDVLLVHAPRYAYVALLAPVVGYFAGWGWAVAELLTTGALVGTQIYLLKVRKSELQWNQQSLREDVRRLRAEQLWDSEHPEPDQSNNAS